MLVSVRIKRIRHKSLKNLTKFFSNFEEHHWETMKSFPKKHDFSLQVVISQKTVGRAWLQAKSLWVYGWLQMSLYLFSVGVVGSLACGLKWLIYTGC